MEIKEIILITNYFPPEKGAASNRMFSLATALAKNGYTVHIVCPFPNYPNGIIFKDFRRKLYDRKNENGLIIHRLWVLPSNSKNKVVRLFSMLSFSLSLKLFFILKKIPKKVFVQYSPIFVGFTGVFWAWVFQKKIILNISDLWPLAGLEMGLLKKGLYYSILERMERFCYRKADLILGQSEEILTHISNLGIQKNLFLYRNYPDFYTPPVNNKKDSSQISLVYGGLLGLAQGLAAICQQINFPPQVTLHVYGSGPEVKILETLQKERIVFHGEVSREQLHKELIHYDIAFIPLTQRIYGSVPSKIFEYTRLGLPVLYYAGGEGDDLVATNKLGWTVPVNNLSALQSFISKLQSETLHEFPRQEVQNRSITAFNFEKQFNRFIEKADCL